MTQNIIIAQKHYLLELEQRLKINKPIFIDRNLAEWKQLSTKINVWEISEIKLSRAFEIRLNNIIGRYKVTGDNSDNCWELWFDVDANRSFKLMNDVHAHFSKLKDAALRLVDALKWFGIPEDYITIKSSGRGFHVTVILHGVKDSRQYEKIVDTVIYKSGLPNTKSKAYLENPDVHFGVDAAPCRQTVRKIREFGGQNDSLQGVFHYCSLVGIHELEKLRKYPFVFEANKVVYPQIKVFDVDKEFMRKIFEVLSEFSTQSTIQYDGEVNFNLDGDPQDLYKCPLILSLKEKAVQTRHLSNNERVFLSQEFVYFGKRGEDELHKIISHCEDYDIDYTQKQIENVKNRNRKPITCEWAKINVGCPPGCEGSGGKSPIKFAWSPLSLEELKEVYRKWLCFEKPGGGEDLDLLEVVLACACDRQVPGIPVWLYIIAPPGGIKTTLITSFRDWKTVSIDSMTTKTLASGLLTKDEKTGKLLPTKGILPYLDGKVLLIKDFTVILSKPYKERIEIFGQLRAAYDGHFDAGFGTLPKPIYIDSKFGLIAGVTGVIDIHQRLESMLGPRFLKIRTKIDREKATKKALENAEKTELMEKELRQKTLRFLSNIDFSQQIEISETMRQKMLNLAFFIAKMRTPSFPKASSKLELALSICEPQTEFATRLVQQLSKLGKLISIIRGKTKFDHEDYKTVLRVGLDTCPQNLLRIVQFLYKNEKISVNEISEGVGWTWHKTDRSLSELQQIKVVQYDGVENYSVKSDVVKYYEKAMTKQMSKSKDETLRLNNFSQRTR